MHRDAIVQEFGSRFVPQHFERGKRAFGIDVDEEEGPRSRQRPNQAPHVFRMVMRQD
jgi:hypothetical protein